MYFLRRGRWVMLLGFHEILFFFGEQYKKRLNMSKKVAFNVCLQVLMVHLSEDNCSVSVWLLCLTGHKQTIIVCHSRWLCLLRVNNYTWIIVIRIGTSRKWKRLIMLPLISFKFLEIVKLTKLKKFKNRVAPYYYMAPIAWLHTINDHDKILQYTKSQPSNCFFYD